MNSTIPSLSPKQLRRAANIKDKIASLQKQLGKLLGGTSSAPSPRKRRKLSAAARAKISAAARARWARVRAGKK